MHATVHTSPLPRTLPLRHSPLALALAAALLAAPPGAALAQVSANQLPTGGSIAGGTGTINATSGATRVVDQTSARMALTWSTFDIGSSATMIFNQPSTSSVVLNVVQAGNPTQIFGNLNANGQVFLINPNGLIFGSTAQINVGGLVASTLGTSISGFMNNNDLLDAGGSTVALMSNSGTINAAAGAVNLIGGKVTNTGTITASAGNINLVGADQVTLTFETGGFGVVVNKALQLQLNSVAVENSGSLVAPGGIITLQARAAQGLFDQLINNSGVIRAASISSGSDGSVSLVANGGGGVGIAGSGSINVGSGAISISTDRSVQQSGVLTAGDLSAVTGGDLSLTGSNQIAQFGGTVGGALTLTNARALGQGSSLEVGGTSTFALGTNALTLDNQGNDFKNTVGITAGATSIGDANALTLGTLSTGALTIANTGALNLGSGTAASLDASSNNGAISQSGALTVAGGSVVNAGTGAITLSNADNDFQGVVGLTGGVTQLRDNNALQLGSVSTGALTVRNTGTLNLGSGTVASLDAISGNGAISQSGTLAVTGTSAINAGSAGIALTTAGNDFGAGVSLTGTGIAVTDSNDLIVSSLTGGSNGAIALTAGGALTLPAQNLTTGTGNLSLIANGAALATNGTLNGANITLTGSQGVTLAHNVGSTGTLALISSNSGIIQTAGAVTAGTTTTVNAGSGSIALTNAANNFGAGVSLTGTGIAVTDSNDLTISSLTGGSNGAIALTAGGALTLPAQNLNTGTGDLSLIANGAALATNGTLNGANITLTGNQGVTLAHNVGSTGTLALTSSNSGITQTAGALTAAATTVTAGSGAITLGGANNDFTGALNLSGGNVQVNDVNALTLGTVATGNLAATSHGGLNLGAGTVGGTLTATSNNAALTQSGALSVSGATTANAGTGAIALTSAGNTFNGAVNLTAASAQIVNAGALTLGALQLNGALDATSNGALNLGTGTVGGTLDASSSNGAINQSGALTVSGLSNLNAGSGNITLTSAGNDFQNAVTLAGNSVQIRDANALTLGNVSTGALNATSSGNLNLGSGSASSIIAFSNSGAIRQSGALNVGNSVASFFNAGTGAITLDNVSNDFRGPLNLTGNGINVASNDLFVSTLNGGSNGAITLTAAGTLSLPAQNIDTGTGALSLTANGNALTTAGTLSGGNVSLRARDGLTLNHSVSASGSLGLNASNNAILQTAGVVTADGLTTIDAGTGTIALDRNNDFKNGIAVTGRTISVVDANDLTVTSVNNSGIGNIALTANTGTLTLNGNLSGNRIALFSGNALTLGTDIDTVDALSVSTNNSAINQTTGSLRIGGASSFNTGTAAIALGGPSNHFAGAVSLTGGTTSVRDSGALTLGSLATGSLTAISNGNLNLGSGSADSVTAQSNGNAIVQTGALTVRQASTLLANGGSITLDNANNDFQGDLSLNGTGITVRDSNALAISSLTSNNNGNIVLTAGGALTLPAQELNNGSGDITLSANGTLNTSGALRGDEVSLFARDGIGLGHDIAARSLSLSSTNAAINQSAGALAITGATTVNAGAGSISLLNTGNDFNSLSLTGSGIAVYDQNALSIATLTSNGNGNVALTAGGALSLPAQSIALGSGNLSLTANGGALSTAGNLSGNNISLTGRDGLTLSNSIAATTLSLSSTNAAINQTAGAIIVAGATTVDAGTASIALNTNGNRFGTGISLTGTGIDVTDSGNLTINALNAGSNGNIALTAGGALNLSAQNIDTGSGNLTLIANGGGLSTGGTLRGRNVTLTARDGLGLGHSIATAETLSLTSNNTAITQTAGALNVGGVTNIDAGTGTILLGNTANTFAGAVNLTGGDVQIAANALTLGALSTNALTASSSGALNLGSGTVRGTLSGTSGNAAIAQTGALSVDGASALNAGSGNIALTDTNNDFINAVSVTGGNVAIADRNALTLGNVSAGALTASSVGALNLGSGSIATTLSATTNNNAITQTGPLTVGGASVLSAGSGAITLRNAANVFQGALSLTGGITQIDSGAALTLGTLSTGALTISNNGALNLGSGNVASLDASSSGNAIAQSGALEVGGRTNLNAGTANITLLNTANDFGDTVTLTAGDARVADRNALTLGTLATGNLAATSVGALNLGSGTIGGTLAATSNNGAINQSGALTVAGTSVLNAGSGSITLVDANNALQDTVDLVGAATQLRNNTALTLGNIDTGALDVGSNGALNLGSGRAASLIASSNGNAITQAGALAIAGSSRLDAGENSITLTNAGNDFADAVSLIGGAVQLTDSNALTLNTLNTGALTLASGGALTLGTGTVDGALTSSADGAIGQNGALTVTGTSSFAAGNNAITLNNAGNDFRDAVSLTGGVTEIADRNDLALGSVATAALTATSNGALNLGSGTIDGALTAQSNNGALTQGGALSVAGISTINAGSGTIVLNSTANTFAGAVNLTGGDVQIAANALTLGALSTNALTASSSGALNLGSGTVRGILSGTSGNAAITQTGALSVGGASTLNAGSGNIALTETNNDFVGALALTGNAIAVQDRNDLSIAALQSGTNAAVSLVAGGSLNLSASQIDTGNGALTLAANGGSLRTASTLRGGDVQLTGANGIELTNALTATNTLSLNSSNAAITQSGGALLVAGNTTVNAGNGAITLDAAGNDFQGLLALSGGASSVRDANALSLGALSTGNLQVSSGGALNLGVGLVNGDLAAASNGGAVTQSGALTVTGSTRINSSGAQIVLTDAGNDFQAAVSLAGGNSSVRDRNALALGDVDVGALDVASGAGLDLGQGRIGGTLAARSGSALTSANNPAVTAQGLAVPLATTAGITQQGALTVVGSSVLDAGSDAIVLTDAGNDFQGNVQARGSSIAIVDRNDLAAAAQATDALRLQAGGQLASSGALSAADIALSGGTGVLLGHDVGGTNVSLSSGGAITQTAGSLSAGRLSGSATGSATLTGSNNAIDVLGDFSAQGLDLISNRTLLVSGRVDGGPSLRLRGGGELQLSGQLSGAASWLQAVAGIRQRAGSTLTANLLSGSAGGPVMLGDASSFIDNRVARLGNFTANSGFSLTNGGDLLLVLANGSSYSVDAGNSAMYLSVRGDLLQDGRAPLRNGTGTFAATGQIGTQQNPLYVIGSGTQTVAAVGAPPAYFNATTADGGLLDLAGGSGFNVPTSAFASRAQSSASRTVAFVDLSASGTPYRAFGLVRPGLRLPDDQQPACDAGDPDAVCSPE